MSYQFVEQEQGPLKIFRMPVVGMMYTVGLDASTGLSEDYTCMQVFSNTIPFEQVAVFRDKWPVNDVSRFADRLGRFYNEAMMVCEVNYPGNSVQDSLLSYYRYPRHYQAETHLDEDIDISTKFGFRTTEATKWMLINEMQLAMANHNIIIHDPVTLSEFLNFVYQSSKKKAGAAEGFNDDTVMAAMLAYHGAMLNPHLQPLPEKKKIRTLDPEVNKIWRDFKANLMRPKERKVGVIL